MKKPFLLLALLLLMSSSLSFAQDMPQETQEEQETPMEITEESETDETMTEPMPAETAEAEKAAIFDYAYVLVDGRLGKRLKIHVDTGDQPFPVPNKKDVIKKFRKKGSYVAVVNFMIEQGYEVVNITHAYEMAAGNAGVEGLSCILRKAREPKTDGEENLSRVD